MPEYTNGKIYKISSRETSKIYIGSTTQKLSDRLTKHRNCIKAKTKCSSIEIINYPDATITLIENYPCNTKKELEIREGIIQRQFLDIIVNKKIAGEKQSKDDRRGYCRKWWNANKDDMNSARRFQTTDFGRMCKLFLSIY